MKEARTIIELSESYLLHKRIIEEAESGFKKRPYKALETSRYIVKMTESRVAELNEEDRFIIFHEVILGERRRWYLSYMSQATYYRHRKMAYKNYIECLKR